MNEYVITSDGFKLKNRLGTAEFKFKDDEKLVVKRLSGLYGKQPKVNRRADPHLVHTLTEHLDAEVYMIHGRTPKYSPWAFAITHDHIIGIDVEYRNHTLTDKPTINVPAERISPGSLTWPKHYYVEVAPDGVAYITPFHKILDHATRQDLVDIKRRLYVSIPKEEWIQLPTYPTP